MKKGPQQMSADPAGRQVKTVQEYVRSIGRLNRNPDLFIDQRLDPLRHQIVQRGTPGTSRPAKYQPCTLIGVICAGPQRGASA